MNRSFFKPLSLLLCLGAAGLIGSCKEDTIPTTPPPPYLFSDLRITNNISPVPGSTLTRGSNVTIRFELAYTLAPGNDTMLPRLGIFADAFGRDSTGKIITPFPLKSLGATPPSLTLVSGVAAESLSFSIPQNVRTITVEAFIDTLPSSSFVVAIDTTSWPVQ